MTLNDLYKYYGLGAERSNAKAKIMVMVNTNSKRRGFELYEFLLVKLVFALDFVSVYHSGRCRPTKLPACVCRNCSAISYCLARWIFGSLLLRCHQSDHKLNYAARRQLISLCPVCLQCKRLADTATAREIDCHSILPIIDGSDAIFFSWNNLPFVSLCTQDAELPSPLWVDYFLSCRLLTRQPSGKSKITAISSSFGKEYDSIVIRQLWSTLMISHAEIVYTREIMNRNEKKHRVYSAKVQNTFKVFEIIDNYK